MPTCDHIAVATDYARSVVAGDVVACRYVQQAAGRFLRDLERDSSEFPYALDPEEASRRCRFLERLPHAKGRWASKGEHLKLEPWQVFIVVNVFGWRHRETGRRRFREAYVEVPRKNGKSFTFAGIGLSVLCQDDDHGIEVYCGAATEKQAWEVFRPARKVMLRRSDMAGHFGVQCNARSITRAGIGARFEPIIGNPGDGSSPSCAIADEFHEHTDSAQVDTMITGMGAREQPLMLYVTTAGADTGGPCYEKRSQILQLLKGTVEDDQIFGIVYTIDEGDAWNTVEAQKKANPNYGISVDPEFLAGQLRQAERSAQSQVAYKTKHLNTWVGSLAAWMNMLAFQACRKRELALEDFAGQRCFVGLDLASRVDVASMAIVFPPNEKRAKWAAFLRRWVPEEVIAEREGGRYLGWHGDGWISSTPGDVIDFDMIEEELQAVAKRHQVAEIAYDPFQATQFSTHMLEAGLPMVEFGQQVKTMSAPMKELEALVLGKSIEFEMDPVLMWMMGNVVARVDAKDNVFPRKERAENKIDDVVALIMAIARAMAEFNVGSIYDTRGIRSL